MERKATRTRPIRRGNPRRKIRTNKKKARTDDKTGADAEDAAAKAEADADAEDPTRNARGTQMVIIYGENAA